MRQETIYRILDANLNRAREGLRVVEDYFRFARNEASIAQRIKALRQKLGKTPLPQAFLISARDTINDVGQSAYTEKEGWRINEEILYPNIKRAQEALRVLEEYSKLLSSEWGSYFKDIRYELYILEQEIVCMLSPRRAILQNAKLYLVTSPSPELFRVVEEALRSGVKILQLRDKTALGEELLKQAWKIRELTQAYNALFIVNDRIDIALLSDADGVHLGQEDVPLLEARKLIGKEKIIGISTHRIEEALLAQKDGADYIGVGPIYETPTKAGRQAVGLEYLKEVSSHIAIPYYAIGGIDLDRLTEVIKAGATRVAVVRAIMDSKDIEATCSKFLNALEGCSTPATV